MQPQPAASRRDTASIVAALLVFVGAMIVVVGIPQPDAKLLVRPFGVEGVPDSNVLWSGRGFGPDDLFMPGLPIAVAVLCAVLGLALARSWLTALAGFPALLVLLVGIWYTASDNDQSGMVISRTIAIGTVMMLVGSAMMVIGAFVGLVAAIQGRKTLSPTVEST